MEITIHFFPGELQSRPCFEFGGHLLFSSTPTAHVVKVEQHIKCKNVVQQGNTGKCLTGTMQSMRPERL